MNENECLEKIKEVLLVEFSSVYCDNCNGKHCEDCYRKQMKWVLSERGAEDVAKLIIKEIFKSE